MDEGEADRLVAAWWSAWWSEDYSWAALASKRWPGWFVDTEGRPVRREDRRPGDRPATLQDFWRAEEGRLISDPTSPDRWFTRAHAPLHWLHGEPEKARWTASQLSEIDDTIQAAIARLPAGAFDVPAPSTSSPPKSKSNPAPAARLMRAWAIPLHGVVVKSFAPSTTTKEILLARQAAIFGGGDLEFAGSIAELDRGLFLSPISLEGERADWRVRGALFKAEVMFYGASIRRLAAPKATFLDSIDLTTLAVDEMTNIAGATVHGSVACTRLVTDRLNLNEAMLHGDVDLDEAKLGQLTCLETTFKADLSAMDAKIETIRSDRAKFEGDADFNNTHITKRADFIRTVWERPADFTGASIRYLDAASAQFKSEVCFEGVTFKSAVTFEKARFEHSAKFDNAVWPGSAEAVGQVFREARFDGYSSFLGDDFWAYAAFDGAKIGAEIRFSRSSFNKDKGLHAALKHAATPGEMEQLEHGLRTLKSAAEAVRDRELEHKLYAYQLRVRRKGPLDWSQRVALSAYAAVSDYGLSLGRPLAWLLGIWAFFTLSFLVSGLVSGSEATRGLGWPPGPPHPALWEAMQMSARGLFNLLGTWSLRPPSNLSALHDLESDLLWRHPFLGLVTRALWTLEAIAAGILIFLAALSVRRWFQIS